jgi:hypothetical protein
VSLPILRNRQWSQTSRFHDMRPADVLTPMALSILINSAFSPSFFVLFALRHISDEVLWSGTGPEYTQFAWGRYGSARRCNHLLRLGVFFIELHDSPFFACGIVVVHSRIWSLSFLRRFASWSGGIRAMKASSPSKLKSVMSMRIAHEL